ncbi:MAG: protein adenylyltransferase SelO family protein, partial [Pseudoclavibacter sp.]
MTSNSAQAAAAGAAGDDTAQAVGRVAAAADERAAAEPAGRSATINPPIALSHDFATAVPELAVPWKAAAVEHPRMLALSEQLANELGLDADALRSEAGLAFLTGNQLPDDAAPVAQAYSGHQWGMYTPQLGDGRALLIGEATDRNGRLRDIHLKGSGATPFSRGGDGLAAIGPMLREFLMGEAFAALGIPATRALAVIGTGRMVRREEALPGALLVRTASSHLRVGSFQIVAAAGNLPVLRRLADHAIDRHVPEAAEAEHPYLAFFEHVVNAQADLVAAWMHAGFVHGVMSTDNTTISGETIDFGPCAFLDGFDPGLWFSSIDQFGRYAYAKQPSIVQWNLARFAEALLPLLPLTSDEALAAEAEWE